MSEKLDLRWTQRETLVVAQYRELVKFLELLAQTELDVYERVAAANLMLVL